MKTRLRLFISALLVLTMSFSFVAIAFAQDDRGALTAAGVFDELARQSGNQTAQARIVTDNVESWYARWHMLSNAKKSLDVTYFIVEKDVFGMSMLGLLLKKAREGVKIRLMMDARGTKELTRTFIGQDHLQELLAFPNVEIKTYNAVSQRLLSVIGNIRHLIGSNHDKIIIADSEWFITGGRNVSMNYFVDPRDAGYVYRDTDVLFRSKGLAAEMQKAFDEEFNSHTAYVLKRDSFGNWVSRALDLEIARRAMNAYMMGNGLLPGDNKIAAKYNEELSKYKHLQSYASYQPFYGDRSYPAIVLDKHSFRGTRNDITPAVSAMIRFAKKEIIIQNPYVILTPEILKALKEANDRGVNIIIHTNSPVSSDSLMTQAFFLEDWPNILKLLPTCKLYAFNGERKLHAKVFVFDREITVAGTYNMDYMSEQINSEVVTAVKSTDFGQRMALRIAEDIKQSVEYKIKVNADGSVKEVFGPSSHSDPGKIKTLKLLKKMGFLKTII
ncbi:MAG: phospholipase D-family protein [uncultured bacterium]|uniref:PLD phosphodiesterase domain-containing protein n=1 Tax=Candidatus Wallbacteria bacterium GWC2_49_35 TaxID=1817813 RepID=A0A1F7WY80_9BACT|nr:MAG: phospholipase D-family protein [uncultured bacterium]OGM07647.1 MAG: hypothetical protein A2008_01820 [Candidatus Wallbacteria bacterium GWC2_49_35]HBC73275.1 hypothetical protein [Candidatus Wallbacteria bacterium]